MNVSSGAECIFSGFYSPGHCIFKLLRVFGNAVCKTLHNLLTRNGCRLFARFFQLFESGTDRCLQIRPKLPVLKRRVVCDYCIADFNHCIVCPYRTINLEVFHTFLDAIRHRLDNMASVILKHLGNIARLVPSVKYFPKPAHVSPFLLSLVLNGLRFGNNVRLDCIVKRGKLLVYCSKLFRTVGFSDYDPLIERIFQAPLWNPLLHRVQTFNYRIGSIVDRLLCITSGCFYLFKEVCDLAQSMLPISFLRSENASVVSDAAPITEFSCPSMRIHSA